MYRPFVKLIEIFVLLFQFTVNLLSIDFGLWKLELNHRKPSPLVFLGLPTRKIVPNLTCCNTPLEASFLVCFVWVVASHIICLNFTLIIFVASYDRVAMSKR